VGRGCDLCSVFGKKGGSRKEIERENGKKRKDEGVNKE
jgi:hypothetical protein